MKTDTSEAGLERLICTGLTGSVCDSATPPTDAERETSAAIAVLAEKRLTPRTIFHISLHF